MGRNIFTVVNSRILSTSRVMSGTNTTNKIVTGLRNKRALITLVSFSLVIGSSLLQKSVLQHVATDPDLDNVTEQTIQNELSAESTIDSLETENLNANATDSSTSEDSSAAGSSSHVRVQSSVNTNSDSESSNETTIEYDNDSDQDDKKSITHESEDGGSSVRYDFNVNSDSDVQIRERGGRIRIEINEKTEN